MATKAINLGPYTGNAPNGIWIEIFTQPENWPLGPRGGLPSVGTIGLINNSHWSFTKPSHKATGESRE